MHLLRRILAWLRHDRWRALAELVALIESRQHLGHERRSALENLVTAGMMRCHSCGHLATVSAYYESPENAVASSSLRPDGVFSRWHYFCHACAPPEEIICDEAGTLRKIREVPHATDDYAEAIKTWRKFDRTVR